MRAGIAAPIAAVFCLVGGAAAAVTSLSEFIPTGDRARAVLEGNWQSCRESDGHYGERIYDNNLPGIGPFELHLGPYHDFALFRGVRDDHREHDSAENLLRPFTVEVMANRARQSWMAAGLRLEVNLGGGGQAECESWFVTLKRAQPES